MSKSFSKSEILAKLKANPNPPVRGTGKIQVRVIGLTKMETPKSYDSKRNPGTKRTFTHIGATNIRSPYQAQKAKAVLQSPAFKALGDDEVVPTEMVNDLLSTMSFNVESTRVPSVGENIEVTINEFTPTGTQETGLAIGDYRYVKAELDTTFDLFA